MPKFDPAAKTSIIKKPVVATDQREPSESSPQESATQESAAPSPPPPTRPISDSKHMITDVPCEDFGWRFGVVLAFIAIVTALLSESILLGIGLAGLLGGAYYWFSQEEERPF